MQVQQYKYRRTVKINSVGKSVRSPKKKKIVGNCQVLNKANVDNRFDQMIGYYIKVQKRRV